MPTRSVGRITLSDFSESNARWGSEQGRIVEARAVHEMADRPHRGLAGGVCVGTPVAAIRPYRPARVIATEGRDGNAGSGSDGTARVEHGRP